MSAFMPPVAWPALTSAKPTATSTAVPAPSTTSSATAELGSSRFASRPVVPGSNRHTAIQTQAR